MKTIHFFFIALIALYVPVCAQNVIKRQAIAGGSGSDYLVNLCLTKDKKEMLTAGYSASDSNQYKRQNSRGGYDYYVIKTELSKDKLKVPEWSKTIGGDSDDMLVAAVATQDGGFLLGGNSNSDKSGEKTENSKGLNDYWLVKLNSNGKIEWDKTIGNSNNNMLQSFDETTDGGFILAGYELTAPFTSVNKLTRLDSHGNILWEQIPDSVSYFYSVQHTSDNGFILAALSNYDVSLLKGDGIGDIQWFKQLYYRYRDDIFAAKQADDGGYIVYGTHALSRCESCGDGGEDYEYVSEVTKTDSGGNILWNQSNSLYNDNAFGPVALEETHDHHYVFGATAGYGVYSFEKIDYSGNLNWTYLVGSNGYRLGDIKEIMPNRYAVGGSTYKGIDGIKKLPGLGGNDYWDIEMADTTGQSMSAAKSIIAIASVKDNKNLLAYPNPAKDIIHLQINGTATIILTNSAGKIIFSKNINNDSEINVSRFANGVYYLQNKTTGETQKFVVVH